MLFLITMFLRLYNHIFNIEFVNISIQIKKKRSNKLIINSPCGMPFGLVNIPIRGIELFSNFLGCFVTCFFSFVCVDAFRESTVVMFDTIDNCNLGFSGTVFGMVDFEDNVWSMLEFWNCLIIVGWIVDWWSDLFEADCNVTGGKG